MTPGYDGQVVGRDCNCEDFPCWGHGLTQRDLEPEYLDYDDWIADHDDNDYVEDE